MFDPTLHSTPSADGTQVGWEQLGSGPALVVVHGGWRAGKHYRALARQLADRFTVVLMDRRGRGLTDPTRPADGLDTEVADLTAVLRATGAQVVFGHSAGAIIALETARQVPIAELALYEPPIELAHSLPLEWVPRFERAVREGRSVNAMVMFLRGLQLQPRWIPTPVLALVLRAALFTDEGKEMVALLRTLPADTALAISAGQHAERYRSLSCSTLLLAGTASPAYFAKGLDALAKVLPHVRRATLEGQSHNAPDLTGPTTVALHLRAFFEPAEPMAS